MTISSGTRLGPYEIVAPIGAGGMGEVYRARDTRLDRSVAVKILPEEFAQNAQLHVRFEREARIISSLSHPNICTLYDVGENYLVMELLEGETVAERVAKGALPVDQVLRIGTEVANALDRAHRQGIVHRDLKPANVMLTKSGAKVLDFGLAKPAAQAVGIDVSGATQQKALTAEGTIVGTFQYMAPEQLEGQDADARTDIFALGCLLYEMATGKRAFDGKTRTSLIAAIVSGEPKKLIELQPLAPAAFEHVIAKCLAKDPEERWQSAADIAAELKWIREAGSQAGVPAIAAHARRLQKRTITAVAIAGWALAVTAAAFAVVYAQRLMARSHVVRTEISASEDFGTAYLGSAMLSPDAHRVVVVLGREGASALWVRDLSSGVSKTLAGTEGAMFPFWSPDSQSIGFFAGSKLKTTNINTNTVQTLCDAPSGRGGTWSREGVIVFAPNIATPLYKVAETGGTPLAVTKPEPGWTNRVPYFLPDGKRFLYCVQQIRASSFRANAAQLWVGSVDGNLSKKVFDFAADVAYEDGWLFFVRDGNLLAQRFDPETLSVSGAPHPVADNIDWYGPRFIGNFSVAKDMLLYRRTTRPRAKVAWLERDGRLTQLGDAGYYARVRVAPNGRRAVVERYDTPNGTVDLALIDLATGAATRSSFVNVINVDAVFSPDGSRIAAASFGGGRNESWIQPAAGGSIEQIWSGTESVEVTDWSRDGKTIVLALQYADTGLDVCYLRLDGDRKLACILHSDAQETDGVLSPDGRWLAYVSDRTGRRVVYVTRFPSAAGTWQVSPSEAGHPHWSADGKLLYFSGDGKVYAAAVRTGDSFESEAPKEIAAVPEDEWDVTADGRLLTLHNVDRSAPPLNVVLNWPELLRK